MNFRVDLKKLTIGEVILLQEIPDLKTSLHIMSKYAVDDSGNAIPESEAMQMLLSTSVADMKDVVSEFVDAVKEVVDQVMSPKGMVNS